MPISLKSGLFISFFAHLLTSFRYLYNAGKFPTLVSHQESLESKVNETKATIKFQLKKVLCMGVAVGNMDMEEKQIFQNVQMSVNFLVSLLKKNWQNVSLLHLSTSLYLRVCTSTNVSLSLMLTGEMLVLEEYHGKDSTHLLRTLYYNLCSFRRFDLYAL